MLGMSPLPAINCLVAFIAYFLRPGLENKFQVQGCGGRVLRFRGTLSEREIKWKRDGIKMKCFLRSAAGKAALNADEACQAQPMCADCRLKVLHPDFS